jgi:PRTRC genetic system protein E
MTMFQELFQLAQSATLTMTISADADGRMTINVVPRPKADLKEAALSMPLTLTATPDEFDADFVRVLSTYRVGHQSLAAQAEATKEVLDAAAKASAKRGADAVQRASTKTVHPAKPASEAGPADGDDDTDTDADGDANNGTSAPDMTPPAKPAADPAPVEPQLFG